MSCASVLICQCSRADILPQEAKAAVFSALHKNGTAFETVEDLCELAARRAPRLRTLASLKNLTIFACYPRAVRALFDAAGAGLAQANHRILNLRDSATEDLEKAVLSATGAVDASAPEAPEKTSLPDNGWHAWFPVIDFERCNGCLDCLNFCLFGVYGSDTEKGIAVQAPESCKPGCPACARVCPETAIIFPKHHNAFLNGADLKGAEASGERVKVDISALLGGDVYSRLRERSEGQRFSRQRDSAEAMRERQRLLSELVSSGDLRPELVAQMGLTPPPR